MSALPIARESRPGWGREREETRTRDALRVAVLVFLASRALLLPVTAAVALIQRSSPLSVWERWDTVWYLGIAAHGYHWTNPGHYATRFADATLAFFPALPGLIHAVQGIGLPWILAGLLVANLAFLGALVYLYHLLASSWGERVAPRALLLMGLFPTAFFFASPYTESLFLLAAAGTIYHAQRGQTLRAGLWLALAALTRSTALILIAPAVLLLRPRDLRAWVGLLAPSVTAWTGYLLYLHAQRVPLSALVTAQHAWHRGLALPITGFTASFTWLFHNAMAQWPLAIECVGGLTVTALFLVLTVRAWPELNTPMRAYCAGFWLLVLCSPEWLDGYAAPFSSVDRFVLVLFPLAGWVASRLEEARLRSRTVVSAGLMAVCAGVHLTGGWIG